MIFEKLKIPGFSSFSLLLEARNHNVITEKQYYEFILELLKFNYFYISIDEKFLLYCTTKHSFIFNEDLELALKQLCRPETTAQSLATVLSRYLKEIWLSRIPDTSKHLILEKVILMALEHHSEKEFILSLAAGLKIHFKLLPQHLKEIVGLIKEIIGTKKQQVRPINDFPYTLC